MSYIKQKPMDKFVTQKPMKKPAGGRFILGKEVKRDREVLLKYWIWKQKQILQHNSKSVTLHKIKRGLGNVAEYERN